MIRGIRSGYAGGQPCILSTEECLQGMFADQGAGQHAGRTGNTGYMCTMGNMEGAPYAHVAAVPRSGMPAEQPFAERRVAGVSGMFADEWELQCDAAGLPVFADQAGYRPAGVAGGNWAVRAGEGLALAGDGRATGAGVMTSGVSGSAGVQGRGRLALQKSLAVPGKGGVPAAPASALTASGGIASSRTAMPQAGPDQLSDLTPDSLPAEELRRFPVCPQNRAYGGTSSIALPAARPVFAELFVQRDEEGRIIRKVMRTALGMDECFYAYDAAGRLIAGGEMVASQGRDPHASRAAKGTQEDQSSGRGGQGAGLVPVEPTGQPLGQSSVQAKVQPVVQARMLTETYLYGPAGERLASAHAGAGEVRYAYDKARRLVQAGAERFAYDDYGRLVGRLSAGGETRYAYDVAGNLTAVALPDGRVVEYLLDAAGRRIAKSVNGVMLEKYAWRGAATLEGTSRPDGSGLCRFLYQQGSRMPACMECAGQRYSIAFDHAGTPFAVANANGDLIQAYKHDAFGNVISMLAENVRIPFGFGGGLLDADTGLVHLGYREYDPRIGRFIQPDPIGYAGGDVDVYGYCLDDPVNLVDPLGLEPAASSAEKGSGAGQKAGGSDEDWCGSGWNSSFVPESPFGNNFSAACREHDVCYGTKGSQKEDCDMQFRRSMDKVCREGGNALCGVSRDLYYGAVKHFGGSAYSKPQQ